jgi:uncharacterized protein (UPF0276 family)
MPAARVAARIPARAGIGWRAPHYRALLEERPALGFLEVHSENYFGDGGAPLYYLERAREHYPVSLHGVGLSLGSADPLSRAHLARLKRLIDRIEPGLVSEHLSWSSVDGRYLNDLLPLPYTDEALAHVTARIREAQDILGRRLLIENLSSYVAYAHSTIPEWEFVAAVAAQADCDLLLDVNNVYVSSRNHGFDAREYLAAIPGERVREIHLAGHMVKQHADGEILIDTHDTRVCAEVWALYRETIARLGARPTLIEWDSALPPLATLVDEAALAQRILEPTHATVAA